MKTLLEIAKETKRVKRIVPNPELMELAIAWIKGEVEIGQVDAALDRANGYSTLATQLRQAYREGKLVIK